MKFLEEKYIWGFWGRYKKILGGGFGELIIDRPNEFAYNDLTNGFYNKLRLQIFGSDKLPIKILDPEISIVLLIREKK